MIQHVQDDEALPADVDVSNERAMLRHVDVAALHERIQASLRFRALTRGVAAGVVATVLAALALFTLWPRDAAAPPSTATIVTAPAPMRTTCDPPPCPSTTTAIAPSQPATSTSLAARVASPSVRAEGDALRASRLRAQLWRFDAAHAALDAGDARRALALLQELDALFPRGALDIEATLLRARALIRVGEVDAARALLDRIANDDRFREKEGEIADVRALLPEKTSAASPDNAAPTADDDDDDDGSRVIMPGAQ